MKTLLVILSYAKANDMVNRHWEYYERAGCDILGVGRTDTVCKWPTGPVNRSQIGSVNFGRDSYVCGDNLLLYLVDVWRHCLNLPYDSFCLVEPDVIFNTALPHERMEEVEMFATPMGGGSPGFIGTQFLHCPWWSDHTTTARLLTCGQRLLRLGLIEQGFPDRWIGLLNDLYQLHIQPANWYSRNLLDRPEYIAEARAALRGGAWGVHGIKTAEQLHAVMDNL